MTTSLGVSDPTTTVEEELQEPVVRDTTSPACEALCRQARRLLSAPFAALLRLQDGRASLWAHQGKVPADVPWSAIGQRLLQRPGSWVVDDTTLDDAWTLAGKTQGAPAEPLWDGFLAAVTLGGDPFGNLARPAHPEMDPSTDGVSTDPVANEGSVMDCGTVGCAVVDDGSATPWGALVCLDSTPHPMTAEQRLGHYRDLRDLASLGETFPVSRAPSPAPGQMEKEDHRTLFELASALLAVFSLDGKFRRLNPAWEKVLGYRREELLDRSSQELVHPDDKAMTRREGIRLRRQSSELLGFENRIRCKDGSYIWLSWNVTSDLDAGYTYAAAFDVSGRRRAEERLRQTVEMRRSITESSPDHILMLDTDGRVLYSNRSLTTGFGDSMLGRPITEHAAEAFRDAIVACLQEVVTTGTPGGYEVEEVAEDGSTIVLKARVGPIRREGKVVALSLTLTDVTMARRASAERERLIHQLEQKNQELERYTYTVSHDLKSPLVTIKGFLGFLEKSALEGDTSRLRDDIARISGAADRMRDLLDELLELSRVGRVVHPPEIVPLDELVHEVMALALEPSQGRTLEVHIDPELPKVRGDRVRLFQVFQNLIDNATKFLGDQPAPRIEVSSRGYDEDRTIFVRDNGIGIDPRYQERVFGLFDKLDPDSGGTGIGLALVHRIIELHGGKIWVESEGLGKGSSFCFTLASQVPES